MKRPGFVYQSGELTCDGRPVSTIALTHGTPCYIYSETTIVDRVRRLKKALGTARCEIHYAVKANSNLAILSLLAKEGCGADIVSGGELYRAIAAGITPKKIVFSGVGKTPEEITEALRADVGVFNIESITELQTINTIASSLGVRARVLFRVNPGVDAKTHPYISTGLKKNKFGLAASELRDALRLLPKLSSIVPLGLSCHIGSQILSLSPLKDSWAELLKMSKALPYKTSVLDLGGGLGVAYDSERAVSLENYGAAIRALAKKNPGVQLGIEPGRCLVAEAGILVSRIIAIKMRGAKRFVVLDAGMNDLIRPALYGAKHCLLPLNKAPTKHRAVIVGPVCESADTFETDACIPDLKAGDLVALSMAGAYGMSMASQYNSRPKPPEILVQTTGPRLIRERETYSDLVAHEIDSKGDFL